RDSTPSIVKAGTTDIQCVTGRTGVDANGIFPVVKDTVRDVQCISGHTSAPTQALMVGVLTGRRIQCNSIDSDDLLSFICIGKILIDDGSGEDRLVGPFATNIYGLGDVVQRTDIIFPGGEIDGITVI